MATKDLTIAGLKHSGKIAFEYVRGSHCHGIATDKSDIDLGGVYFADFDELIGLRDNYQELAHDEKNDVVYYEFGRWVELLLKSNPTALEGLFVDDEFITEMSPEIKIIRRHRNEFLSKDCFNSLTGYAKAQIAKATGYNKKCMIPDNFQRQELMDFCFVAGDNEDTIPLKKWLKDHKMLQKYIGLSKRTNMPGCFSMFYDFGSHFKYDFSDGLPARWGGEPTNLCYEGVVNPDGTSNDVRLSSIPKGQKAVGTMYFNLQSYQKHCREYKDWVDWKKNRNEVRYESNKDHTYDAKNMCECIRLMHTGIELIRDGVMNIKRTWDREFLLDVKNHKYSYEFLDEYIKGKYDEFQRYEKNCKLPDHIDADKVNEILIKVRREHYEITQNIQ